MIVILAFSVLVGTSGTATASHCNGWEQFWSPGQCVHEDPEPSDPCAGVGDTDGDGICDPDDDDIDGDGWDNACDPGPLDSSREGGDFDGDGKCDLQDDDIDNDGVPNECDPNNYSEAPTTDDPATYVDRAGDKALGVVNCPPALIPAHDLV